jgi:glycosyltransferase involved in cell wall biosynthesis
MPPRVLYFFPHNPYRGLTGAHQRALEVLSALSELGCDVTLFGSTATSEVPWDEAEENSTAPNRSLILHRPGWTERAYLGAGRLAYRALSRRMPSLAAKMAGSSQTAQALCPRSMRAHFASAIRDTDPDVLFMSYAYWDGLIDHRQNVRRLRVIDTIDLLSLAAKLRARVDSVLQAPVPDPASIPDEVVREDYFDTVGDVDRQLQVECNIYDQYSVTIAISPMEADTIASRAPHTSVIYLPMTRAVRPLDNRYDGPALFAGGLNPFNIHGYLYLCKRVLPPVRAAVPDFTLEATGAMCPRLAQQMGVRIQGILPDLDPVYERAGFFVNPVYGGTGQQVKVIDAMAHGLPVVSLARGAVGSPVRHGENGLIAQDAVEFAGHVCRLWRDRPLCRRLGEAARATIESECSPARLREGLGLALGVPQSRRP